MQSDFSKAFTENVAEILQNFETNYGIKSNLIIAGETLDNIKKENQMELLRIFQEALSNIARHANATEVTVQLTEVGDDLKFNIKDNGVGFDVEMLNQDVMI